MNTDKDTLISENVSVCARIVSDPAGRSVSVLTEADAVSIARKLNYSLVDVYLTALASDIWPLRYIRNRSTLSSEEQQRLGRSSVAVIGCGGLGGYLVLMLARMGIGSITVVDPDVYDESNLNRQAFAFINTIGYHKTDVAASTVQSVNPAVDVKEFRTALSGSNAEKILHDSHIVVDALDNLPDREMLRQVTRKLKLPLVHGAIAGFEGQVMSFHAENSGSSDLFQDDRDTMTDRESNAESMLGVPSITPVFIASLQAMEVLKILLRRGNPLIRRMLYSDIELAEFHHFEMPA